MTGYAQFDNVNVVTKGSSPRTILKEFSLEIAKGEVVALVGESGAGKSTAGLSALGYAKAGCRFGSGHIAIDGKDLADLQQRGQIRSLRGQEVAYVAQSAATAFNPSIRIVNQLVEACSVHGIATREEATARALDLAESMGLPEPGTLIRRFPHQLSGGQLQRLMTVMALMCRPSLLVLDEPTTALDVTSQLGVLIALRKIIRQEKVACLYISHDLSVVAQIADRIVVMRNGTIVEANDTKHIIYSPNNEYTHDLVAAANPSRIERNNSCDAGNSENVLKLAGIDAYYGSAKVLDDIELSIGRSECIAIIGESGSGKSTLARVVTGLLPARQGTIEFHGNRLEPSASRRSKDVLRRIQLVLQHPDLALNPRMTVGDAIGRSLELFFGLRGEERDRRIRELLELTELPADVAGRYPSQLSGGQKQRINLARAITAEPDLLICDEVTSALDTLVAGQVLNLLARLRSKLETACIFITHDVSKAAALADRIYVMYRGKIVEHGAPSTLLSNPGHSYTKTLLQAVPELRLDWLSERMAYLEA